MRRRLDIPQTALSLGAETYPRRYDGIGTRAEDVAADVTLALLEQEGSCIDLCGEALIWDPACGDGSIGRVLEAAGYTVIGSDPDETDFGVSKVDFLACDLRLANIVVSCPPVGQASEYARHLLVDLQVGYAALLVPTDYLHGHAGRSLFRDMPPTFAFSIAWPMRIRETPLRPGEAMWCVWLGAWRGPTELRLLDRPMAPPLDLRSPAAPNGSVR